MPLASSAPSTSFVPMQAPSSARTQSAARSSVGHAQSTHIDREGYDQRTQARLLAYDFVKRLRYAHFKVEHGWTKQSLPEVENLYFRAQARGRSATGTGSSPLPQTSAGPAVGLELGSSHDHRDALLAQGSPTAHKSSRGSNDRPLPVSLSRNLSSGQSKADVFGQYGYATPPTTGGSSTSHARAPGSRATPSAVASHNFPLSPPASIGSNRGGDPSARGAGTYAEFWNKVGNSPYTAGHPSADPLSSPAANRKRSAPSPSPASAAAPMLGSATKKPRSTAPQHGLMQAPTIPSNHS